MTDYRFGYVVEEPTKNTLEANPFYKFGRYQMMPDKFPTANVNITPYHQSGSSREPQGYNTAVKSLNRSMFFDYIHAYPLFLFMGASSGTTTKTITAAAVTAEKKTFNSRYTRVEDITLRKHILGCMANNISVSVDYRQTKSPNIQMGYRGQQIVDSADTANPAFPTGVTDALYDKPDTLSFNATNILSQVLGITFSAVDDAQMTKPSYNSLQPNAFRHGDHVYGAEIQMIGGKSSQFHTFFNDWAVDDAGQTLIWKHSQQGTSNYIQATMTGCAPRGEIDSNVPWGELAIDKIPLQFKSLSIEAVDGYTSAY